MLSITLLSRHSSETIYKYRCTEAISYYLSTPKEQPEVKVSISGPNAFDILLLHLQVTKHSLPNGGFHIRLAEDLSFLEAPESFGIRPVYFHSDNFGKNLRWKMIKQFVSEGLFTQSGNGKSRNFQEAWATYFSDGTDWRASNIIHVSFNDFRYKKRITLQLIEGAGDIEPLPFFTCFLE